MTYATALSGRHFHVTQRKSLEIQTCSITTRSYFSEGNSVSFPERYSKSEKGWDFGILRMRSRRVWGNLCKGVALRRTDPLSCQSLCTLKCIYLSYFPLTLPYWREVLPYIGQIDMSSLKGYEQYGVDFGHCRLKLGMVFYSSLELGKFLRRSYFFIIKNKTSNYSHSQYL